MPWVKLDETFPDHKKLARCGDAAPLCGWLYVCALSFCNRQLTDGRIPKAHIYKLVNFHHITLGPKAVDVSALAERLVQVGLWEDDDEDYVIHDYGDYQPSQAEVLQIRAIRAQAGREGGLASQANRKQLAKQVAKQVAKQTASKRATPFPVPDQDQKHVYPQGALKEGLGGKPRPEEHRADARDTRPNRKKTKLQPPASGRPNVRQLVVLAKSLRAEDPHASDADLKEDLKARAAQLRMAYDADSVRKALDQVQRAG